MDSDTPISLGKHVDSDKPISSGKLNRPRKLVG